MPFKIKQIPKSGYIDALDFYSPKDLADYLIYLDQNKTAYNSYFKWKKYISALNSKFHGFMSNLCNMCIYLQLENFFGIKSSRIDDVATYWGLKENCKEPYMEVHSNISLFKVV